MLGPEAVRGYEIKPQFCISAQNRFGAHFIVLEPQGANEARESMKEKISKIVALISRNSPAGWSVLRHLPPIQTSRRAEFPSSAMIFLS
jgi:hypothetical protein